MTNTVDQIEKNVSASFAYVKKDMLMLNDAFSDLHEKVQHLSMNHAALLDKIQQLENALVKDEKKLKSVAKKAKKHSKKKSKKKSTKKTSNTNSKKKSTKKSTKKTPKKVIKTEEITYG